MAHIRVMPTTTRLTELTDRAVLSVTGPDWRAFLQGLLTQDVETLKAGEARYAALLNPQGRLLFDLFLIGVEDGALLDVAASRRDALAQRLAMYRLRAKATIAPTEDRVFVLWNGPGGEGWLADPRLASLGFRAYGAEPPPAPGAEAATAEDYDVWRLAQGVPDPPRDCGDEKAYPIEANFDLLNGIDFKKGCYVGQETTSRMKRRAGIKSRMLPIAFDGAAPQSGAQVSTAEGLRGGEVLTGRDGAALALVRLDRVSGAQLNVEGRPVRLNPPQWLISAL